MTVTLYFSALKGLQLCFSYLSLEQSFWAAIIVCFSSLRKGCTTQYNYPEGKITMH